MARQSKQREYMTKLVEHYGMDEERVIREYASAEERGDVERKSNTHGWTAKQYARALWRDGVRKGWIGGAK
jgi:hypothetical protein